MWHVIATLFVVSIAHWVYRWSHPKCKGKLPPGSMGWPLLGETLYFFATNQTWDIPPFINDRMKRYGSIFRTSFVGLRVIISADSELNNMVFQQEGQLFQSWYPESVSILFGEQNLSTLHGYLHKYIKNMVLNLVGYESLKKMLFEVESATTRNIESWVNVHEGTVDLKTATADVRVRLVQRIKVRKMEIRGIPMLTNMRIPLISISLALFLCTKHSMILGLTANKLISYDLEKSPENLRENFEAFIKGLISIPLAVPGTAYHKCLQGRKKVMRMLKSMLEERQRNHNKVNKDFFDYVLEEVKQEDTLLTESMALDLMFLLLFASFETTSTALLVAIKLLTDNPQALKELTEEHEKILAKRENQESGLTWKEYKSMTYTFQVINESLRLANIVPGIFRKAITDVKIKDYTIPSGWVVMVCPPALHLDPANYKDPLDFDPSRWEGMDFKGASKTFMAFGGGQRFCVGADFARLQMAVFLHCLVTRYRWQLIKGGDIIRTPGLQFPNGFHIQLFEKHNQNKQK